MSLRLAPIHPSGVRNTATNAPRKSNEPRNFARLVGMLDDRANYYYLRRRRPTAPSKPITTRPIVEGSGTFTMLRLLKYPLPVVFSLK